MPRKGSETWGTRLVERKSRFLIGCRRFEMTSISCSA